MNIDKKKLLIYAHYYIPDIASTGQILRELAEGLLDVFDVTVICVVPSYLGTIEDKYKSQKYYKEEINGVKILRIRVPEFDKTNGLSRIKNILSYFLGAVSATFKVGKMDYVFSISQPPILGGLLGVWGKWMKHAKLIYNIQDFNPEQIISVSYTRNKLVIGIMMWLDKFSCRKSDLIITVGRDLGETIKQRFAKSKRVPKYTIINNWINEKEIYPLDRSGRILCLNDQETILSRYLRDGMKVIKSYAVCTKLYKRECFTSIRFPIGQLYEDIVTNYDILSNSLGYAISDKICYYYFRKNGSITRTKYTCRDNDYIRDGEQLLERTQGIKNLYKYAKMSLARYYFMCICKMMKYGFADDVDVKGITDRGISIIRENLIILLTSPMAVSRKIVLIAVSLNKWAVVKIIKMANRVYDKND